jgi:hypothetical protein
MDHTRLSRSTGPEAAINHDLRQLRANFLQLRADVVHFIDTNDKLTRWQLWLGQRPSSGFVNSNATLARGRLCLRQQQLFIFSVVIGIRIIWIVLSHFSSKNLRRTRML